MKIKAMPTFLAFAVGSLFLHASPFLSNLFISLPQNGKQVGSTVGANKVKIHELAKDLLNAP
jgi:hypothetical protein